MVWTLYNLLLQGRSKQSAHTKMVSLLAPGRAMNHGENHVIVPVHDDDIDDDSNVHRSSAPLPINGSQFSSRPRLRQMVGVALQQEHQNSGSATDVVLEDKSIQRSRRLGRMRALGRKKSVAGVSKMAQLVYALSEKPIVKFRRIARAVLSLIQVCQQCKDIMTASVRKESWFALIDSLIAKTSVQQKRKAPRAFVTFVPNERRELVQLTFNVAEYRRDKRTELILTDEVREMMTVLPGYRTVTQVTEIIRVLKLIFPSFAHHKLNTQKAIGQTVFYDKYKANRVIVKKGHRPDGIYYVLSGCVVEKHGGIKQQPVLINTGELFGEGDLLCGTQRSHTVLTKVDSELLFLHREDYTKIFEVSEESINPKTLDICRQHVVFQHFPMQKLVENPGTWSVNTYKYGQLIAEDSNSLDWIYVIKSGEARVFKFLCPNNVDVKARRRRTQALINSQSPFHRKKIILDFVNDREYIRSSYHQSSYRPPVDPRRAATRSAPPTSSPASRTLLLHRGCVSLPGTRQGPRESYGGKSFSPTFRHGRLAGDLLLPRLILNGDFDKDPEVKDEGQGQDEDQHGERNGSHKPVVVIQETVEELPASLVTSRRSSVASDPLGGTDGHEEGRRSVLDHGDVAHNKGSDSPVISLETENPGDADVLINDSINEDQSAQHVIELFANDLNGSPNGSPSYTQQHKLGIHTEGDGENYLGWGLNSVDKDLHDDPERHGLAAGRLSAVKVQNLHERDFLCTEDSPPQDPMAATSSVVTAADSSHRSQPAVGKRCDVGGAGSPGRERGGKTGKFVKTPRAAASGCLSTVGKGQHQQQVIQVGNHTLPAYVQVETLHPGQVFGLRSCLDPEERGPSVSLVSGECEVLQINKKFFMRHCDDAIFSLIRLKNKPFPSEEELIDRLDVNLQWEEYKQKTFSDFLRQRRYRKIAK